MRSTSKQIKTTSSEIIGSKKNITITGFYDQGGQNKIYRGKMTFMDPVEGGAEKTVEVICKTAQIEKNPKFATYL